MKSNNNFKVLFVYPNIQMRNIAPPGIAQLAGVLKSEGFQVDVFDVTRYEDSYTNPEEDYDSSHEKFNRMDIHKDRVKNSNVLPFDWGKKNIELKTSNVFTDFRDKVESFGPDLIAVSLVENTYELGMNLLKFAPQEIPVFVGGVFSTYATEIVINHPCVNYACRGEGEYPLLELCQAMVRGDRTDNIPNVWSRDKNGMITRNQIRGTIDINELPLADFTIFEESLFYSPMQGQVWKMIGMETQRGCPFTCAYCNSPSNNYTYSDAGAGRFHRKKSVDRLKIEFDHLIKTHNPEFIYFVADTFLAMSKRELEEFSEFYQDYKLPFWMNTRAETVTEFTAKHLAKMNCLRFNIGIEHGNEDFVDKVMRRKVSNKKVIEAFSIAADYSSEFTCVANSIIGVPTETPELVFDTIELNRALPDEIVAAGAFIFAPFWGTPLRELAIQRKYISPDLICTESSNTSGSSLLKMPHFTAEQIDGFMRTFSFYVKFPKDRWSEIDKARELTPEGDRVFDKLRDEYSETYLNPLTIQKKVEWTGETAEALAS